MINGTGIRTLLTTNNPKKISKTPSITFDLHLNHSLKNSQIGFFQKEGNSFFWFSELSDLIELLFGMQLQPIIE